MAEKGTLLQALPPVTKSKLLKSNNSGDTEVSQSTSTTSQQPVKLLSQMEQQPSKPKALSQIELLQSRPQVEKQVKTETALVQETQSTKSAKAESTAVVAVASEPAQEDAGGGSLAIVIAGVALVAIAAGVFFFVRKPKGAKETKEAPVASTSSKKNGSNGSTPAVEAKAEPASAIPARKLPAKPKAPSVSPGGVKLPSAPVKPGLSPNRMAVGQQSATPAPNAPTGVKAPSKPKKRF